MRIDPYWFDSGTPTFLARRIKNMRIFPLDVNGKMATRDELIAVGLNDRDPIPLMFQTGYLTRTVYLIGVNYDSEQKKRGLKYEIEIMEKQ